MAIGSEIWAGSIAAGGVVVLGATFAFRHRMPDVVRLGVLVIGSLVVGLGAVGVQERASAAEWILAPAVLGALAVLHDRLLFAGEGPGRI